MAGGKKDSKGRSSGRYFESPGSSGARGPAKVCRSDRRLVPRIKEYIKQQGTDAIELDDLIAGLKSTYREYSRKGHAFKVLVGQLHQSLRRSSSSCMAEEEWLEQREWEHFEKRLREADGGQTNDLMTSPVTTSDEEGEEEEDELLDVDISLNPQELNAMNNMLLALYKTNAVTSSEDPLKFSLDSSQDTPSMSLPPRGGSNGPVMPVPCEPMIAAAGHIATSDVDIEKQDADMATQNASETSKLVWQSITKTPEQAVTTPTLMTTPTSSANSIPSSLKKVTFSTPEVTKRHQFEVPEEEGGSSKVHVKVKKPKKRHRHHTHGEEGKQGAGPTEEGAKSKRRKKSKEGGGGETSQKQKSSTDFSVLTSSTKFADVGGCDKTLQEICKLLLHFRHPEVFSRLGVCPPLGFLLHGPPGCGKTLLAHAIAGELNLPFIKLAATEVVSGVSGESEGTIRDLFSLAKSHAPCILFIDEVDAICRKRETAQREMERRIVTQLLSCMDDLNASESHARVLVIGATTSPDSLDPGLRRAGRFDREISLGIPDQQARESILKVLGRGLQLETGFTFTSISPETPGFVGADLLALVREASLCAVNRILSASSGLVVEEMQAGASADEVGVVDGRSLVQGLDSPLSEEQLSRVYITNLDFMEALKVVQPSAKREGFATVPDVTWEDVGALEAIREELSYAILAPVRYPQKFASLGLTSPPGILLSGPPGCGKTLLAKAIANESGINFISVKGPELLNMYVGESERAVRQVFQRARNSSPCVIFFDELDALCPKRSDMAESSASSRVVNQLLTEMDGLVARRQVFIMGATNRPDIIDPAVLRPGRLDKILYVGLPTAQDRLAILQTITKAKPRLSEGVDLVELAGDKHTGGYSGADLSALVREAAIAALREYMCLQPLGVTGVLDSSQSNVSTESLDSSQSDGSTESPDGECVVEMKHFMAAVAKIKPSVSEKDRQYYEQMAKKCSSL